VHRWMSVSVAGLVILLALSLSAPPAVALTEIRWLQWWVNEWGPDNHASLIARFEKENPDVKVTVIDSPYPQMAGKLNAAAAAGDGSYDLFGVEASWISGLLRLGYIEKLDPWLARDRAFADSLVETAQRRLAGGTYSLCLYMIPYHFAYNVDALGRKGLQPPRSWDEFVAVLRTLRDKSQNRYGMSMPLSDAGFIMTRYLGYRLAQEGGRWIDADGRAVFNSPEGVAALTFWKDLYAMDLVVPGSLGENQTQMLEYLAAGQVDTTIDGPFIWTKAKQVNPNIRIAYAPPWKLKTGGYQWSCSGLGLNAKSQNKEAAWRFMRYLYSRPASVQMTKTISLPWATKAAMASLAGSADPILRYVPDFASQDTRNNLVFPVLPEASKLLDAVKTAFQDGVTGKKNPKAALDEAAAIWQAELSKVR
jgi:ABC-type glycerol-3-phosphate transport system substrate-binding protein